MLKKFRGNRIFASCVMLAIVALFFVALFTGVGRETKHVPYTEFLQNFEYGLVSQVTISDSAILRFSLIGDDTLFTTTNPRNPGLTEELLRGGVDVTEGGGASGVVQIGISLVFFAAGIFVVAKIMGKHSPSREMAFSVREANENGDVSCTFDDVAGNREAKESVQDLVDFIKNPKKYSRVGARIPRGIIFYGAPGTGKTLLAKAVAGEGGVPFFSVSGSDFVQMYVGVGAKRIRELFKSARAKGQAVIFIDEIDALGKKRQGSVTGGSDERDQTLNALLTEMSGFSSSEGIIVIAATNRLDTLDEALLRPGRFDRHVEISLPDLGARKAILEHHASNKPLAKDIDLGSLARKTVYFSGAMLENLLNEAAILAAKSSSEHISYAYVDQAFMTILAGAAKADRSHINEHERRITAYHEAGHALVARLASPETIVSKVSIIPSTKGAGGFCMNVPPEKMYYTKRDLEAQIKIALAGRASEEIIFGVENITTGASSDIEKATKICKDYVAKYAMGNAHGLLNLEIFDAKAQMIDECKQLLDRLYQETKDDLHDNLTKLHSVSGELLAKEVLEQEDIERLVAQAA